MNRHVLVYVLLVGGALPAQDAPHLLEEGAAHVAAKRWQPALEVLLRVRAASPSPEQCEAAAGLMVETGEALRRSGAVELALKGHEGALALRREVHGDGDDPGVAISLYHVSSTLAQLRRPGDALSFCERAVAMQRRLAGDDDDADLARSIGGVGSCLRALGRRDEAIASYEEALAMERRLHGDGDDATVARRLMQIGWCAREAGRFDLMLSRQGEALAMWRRLRHGPDSDVAAALLGVADACNQLDRNEEALAYQQEALEMRRRLHVGEDSREVSDALLATAATLRRLGRLLDALALNTEALAVDRRLSGGKDDPDVATSLCNVAVNLQELSRCNEALPLLEERLAMDRRRHGDLDDPEVAMSLTNLAACLVEAGRPREALPHYRASLEMWKRLRGAADDPWIAFATNNVGFGLQALGRYEEALPMFEEALQMRQRLSSGRDRAEVALGINNVAYCTERLGRVREALPLYERALEMRSRLAGGRDDRLVAQCLANLASCLEALGRYGEALPLHERALVMRKNLDGGRDHSEIAVSLGFVARALERSGRAAAALPLLEERLAMERRIRETDDHPMVAHALGSLASCLSGLGRGAEALPLFERAVGIFDRVYGRFGHPDAIQAVEDLVYCLILCGRVAEAAPLAEAALAAWRKRTGDGDDLAVVKSLRYVAFAKRAAGDTAAALEIFESALAMYRRLIGDRDTDQVVWALNNIADCHEAMGNSAEALRSCRLACATLERIRDEARISNDTRQSLFDRLKSVGTFERLQRLCMSSGDPEGAMLAADRARSRSLLDFVEQQRFDPLEAAELAAIRRGDDATAQRIPVLRRELDAAELSVDETLNALLRLDETNDAQDRDRLRTGLMARMADGEQRGRQLADERARLVGDVLPVGRVRTIEDVQSVMRQDETLLVYSLAEGAAFVYALSRGGGVDAFPLDLTKLGPALQTAAQAARAPSATRGRDPSESVPDARAEPAATSLFEQLVPTALWERIRSARRVFIAPHRALHALPFEALITSVEDGRPRYWLDVGPPIGYVPSASALHWLRRRAHDVGDDVTALDLLVVGDPSTGESGVHETSRTEVATDPVASTRTGDLERIGRLPPLNGARAEAEAIERVFAGQKERTRRLLGAEATETAVFDLAAKVKYLHFACHGIAEEYAGQSLSLLVLAQPKAVSPGDDGLLKLPDLLNKWRSRLSSCRLVVLSACQTNVGPTLRDEAPQALPIGFLFAGAPAVVSSLWAVDDDSTKELMVDFYSRLLAGETDQLAAFTAARKALRAKYPDPFQWAPFVYMGTPE